MAAKLKKRALAEYQSQVLTEDAAASSGNCEFNVLWFFICLNSLKFGRELWKWFLKQKTKEKSDFFRPRILEFSKIVEIHWG